MSELKGDTYISWLWLLCLTARRCWCWSLPSLSLRNLGLCALLNRLARRLLSLCPLAALQVSAEGEEFPQSQAAVRHSDGRAAKRSGKPAHHDRL